MEQHHHNENCRKLFGLLSDYLNLELPEEACEEVQAHMENCPPCIDFTESLRKTVELCRGYRPAEMPNPISDGARRELLASWEKVVKRR